MKKKLLSILLVLALSLALLPGTGFASGAGLDPSVGEPVGEAEAQNGTGAPEEVQGQDSVDPAAPQQDAQDPSGDPQDEALPAPEDGQDDPNQEPAQQPQNAVQNAAEGPTPGGFQVMSVPSPVAEGPIQLDPVNAYFSEGDNGTFSGGQENVMSVKVLGETPENFKNYVWKVQEPNGGQETEVTLLEQLQNTSDPSFKQYARWEYKPNQGGVYKINVYADGSARDPLSSTTITLYQVNYHDGNGQIDSDQDTVVYCKADAYMGAFKQPKVKSKGAETDLLVGWLTKDPAALEDPGTKEKDLCKQINKAADIADGRGEDHTVHLYALMGQKDVYSMSMNTKDSLEGATNENVSLKFNEAQVGYDPAAFAQKVYLFNTGNKPAAMTYTQQKGQGRFTATYEIPSEQQESGHSDRVKVGGYAVLTIQPVKGLGKGTYEEKGAFQVYINGNDRAFHWIDVHFNVVRGTAVTVKLENETKAYGVTLDPSKVEATITGPENTDFLGKTLSDIGVTVSCEGFRADMGVGFYPYVIEASNDDYDVTLENKGTVGVTVKKAELELYGVTAEAVRQGSTLESSVLHGTAYNNSLGQVEVPGKFEWVHPETVVDEEGFFDVKFVPDEPDNYNESPIEHVQVKLTEKEQVEIRPNNFVSGSVIPFATYDGKPHAATFSVYKKGTDSIVDVPVRVMYDKQLGEASQHTAEVPIDAGTWHVHAYVDSKGYAPAEWTGTIKITPAVVGVTLRDGVTVETKKYDGTVQATLMQDAFTIVGMKERDAGKVWVDTGTVEAAFASADAGKDKSVTVKASNGQLKLAGERAGNYQPVLSQGTRTFYTKGEITPKAVTLTLTDSERAVKEYGQYLELTANDFTAEGLAQTDDISALGLQVTSDGLSQAAEVGEYPIHVQTNATGSNYTVTLTGDPQVVVNKAKPVNMGVSAANGQEGEALKTVTPMGTFENAHTRAVVEGTLEWVDPDYELVEGSNTVKWRFTPKDDKNYESLTGTLVVTATKKPPVPVDFITPKEDAEKGEGYDGSGTFVRTYDGEQQVVGFALDPECGIDPSSVEVLYKFSKDPVDQEPVSPKPFSTVALSDTSETLDWTAEAPVHAGEYELKVIVEETDDYAGVELQGRLVVEQAIPYLDEATLKTTEVKKNGYLGQSTLSGDFYGTDKKTKLTGTWTWENVGGEAPGAVPVVNGKAYEWVFLPAEVDGYNDYRLVKGSAPVYIEADTRTVNEAEVYSLPAPYSDYAVVKVDLDEYFDGDTFTLYADANCTKPISSPVAFSEDGTFNVQINADALNAAGGILYVKIDGVKNSLAVPYKAELGFTLTPDPARVEPNGQITATAKPTDAGYKAESYEWTLDGAAEKENKNEFVEMTPDNASAALKGLKRGSTKLTVKAVFPHPDTVNHPNEKIEVTKTLTITVGTSSGSGLRPSLPEFWPEYVQPGLPTLRPAQTMPPTALPPAMLPGAPTTLPSGNLSNVPATGDSTPVEGWTGLLAAALLALALTVRRIRKALR